MDIPILQELGCIPEFEPKSELNARWDKREDCDCNDRRDYGWIGEDEEGIWTRRNPEIALSVDPELHDVVSEWRCVIDREISFDDFESRSHWWICLWLSMFSASNREQQRYLKNNSKQEEE